MQYLKSTVECFYVIDIIQNKSTNIKQINFNSYQLIATAIDGSIIGVADFGQSSYTKSYFIAVSGADTTPGTENYPLHIDRSDNSYEYFKALGYLTPNFYLQSKRGKQTINLEGEVAEWTNYSLLESTLLADSPSGFNYTNKPRPKEVKKYNYTQQEKIQNKNFAQIKQNVLGMKTK